MATIFISYRRTDAPQACRVYDWLIQRFGEDTVFLDVSAIPFAVSFPEFIRDAISKSKVMIVLIGEGWDTKINHDDDPVRMELETAFANRLTVLPVLIGNTPMPDADKLPASISQIASRNAIVLGVLLDFHMHMRVLLRTIESALGRLSEHTKVTADPSFVYRASESIIRHLENAQLFGEMPEQMFVVESPADDVKSRNKVCLFIHRIKRLPEQVELHFLLSFGFDDTSTAQRIAGSVVLEFEKTPTISDETSSINIRQSDEDPRQIWRMSTDMPLRLSLAYVASVSPSGAATVLPSAT